MMASHPNKLYLPIEPMTHRMRKVRIKRWKDGVTEDIDDVVAEETFLHLEINEKIGFDTIISPQDVKEFVYGNLFSEGFVDDDSEVHGYRERQKDGDYFVSVDLDVGKEMAYKRNYNILWTDCTTPTDIQKRMGDRIEKIDSPLKVRASDIPLVRDRIADKIDVYKQTGAYHYAFLLDSGMDLAVTMFDVSRHNAVDKVIGSVLLAGDEFGNKVLFVTGRITSNMIWKCLRAGIPLAMSRSAPLLEAIELAKEYGMGVIGFARGKRFNLYSGERFIEW